MKIGVAGPGAVGSYYGAKLWRAGHEVHFLLRSDYEQVRRQGVKIISPEGDFHAQPRAARRPEEIGRCDLVIIALKSTANAVFPDLLPPLVNERTAVLTLQNGLGNEEALEQLFRQEQILGGLCFVCLNRIAPGVVQHTAHGKIEMGEFGRWPEPRTHDIATAFRQAGIPCSVRENLELAHWEKLVWNIPFNGLSVASAAGLEAVRKGKFNGRRQEPLATDGLLGDTGWLELVRALAGEVIAAANAQSLHIPLALADEQIERTRVMGAYHPSTLVDFLNGRELELASLFEEPLHRAEKSGANTPVLRNVCRILRGLAGASPAGERLK